MKHLTLMLFGLLLLAGCDPLRHYQKVAIDTDVTKTEKDVIRPWVVTNFPISVVVQPGTPKIDTVPNQKEVDALIGIIDDLNELLNQNSDNALINNENAEAALTYKAWFLDAQKQLDNLKAELRRKCVTVTNTIHDTAWLEHGPVIEGLQSKVIDLEYKNTQLETKNKGLLDENTELNRQVNKSNLTWWLIIVGLSVVILGLVFLLFKK